VRSEEFIGVERVKLPIYLMDSPIYRKDTPYHLEKIEGANWIQSMDEHLTNILISYFQKSLNNSNIYPYPWSKVGHIDKRVSVTITKFIAYGDEVYLEANYQILDRNSKKTSNFFINIREPIRDKSIESMIKSMEEAYFKLSKDISSKL
jgi:cholesterol transport system auxiliary component